MKFKIKTKDGNNIILTYDKRANVTQRIRAQDTPGNNYYFSKT